MVGYTGLKAQAAEDIVEAHRSLRDFLFDGHPFRKGFGILLEAVNIVAAFPAGDLRGAADSERGFTTSIRAKNCLNKTFRFCEVFAGLGASGFRGRIGIAADLPHTENWRRRTLDDLNTVHRREDATGVALQGESAHAAEISVGRNIADVDSALDAEPGGCKNAGHNAGEILHRGKREALDGLAADQRRRTRSFHQSLAETKSAFHRLGGKQIIRVLIFLRCDEFLE